MFYILLLVCSLCCDISGDKAGSTYVKLANCHLKVSAFHVGIKHWVHLSYVVIVWTEFNDSVFLCLQLESKHEAAQAFVDAAHCYKKTSINGIL